MKNSFWCPDCKKEFATIELFKRHLPCVESPSCQIMPTDLDAWKAFLDGRGIPYETRIILNCTVLYITDMTYKDQKIGINFDPDGSLYKGEPVPDKGKEDEFLSDKHYTDIWNKDIDDIPDKEVKE